MKYAVQEMKWLFLIYCFAHMSAQAQLRVQIVDRYDARPLPFVSVSVLNANHGYTTNAHGFFELDTAKECATIVCHAAGYHVLSMKTDTMGTLVKLHKKDLVLQEVEVFPRGTTSRTIDRIRKPLIAGKRYSMSNRGAPVLVAKAYPFKEDISATPFLKSVAIRTSSEIEDAVFQLHLFALSDSGKPAAELIEEGVLVTAPKGSHIIQVDLSNYRIRIPENGMAVGVQWLLIEDNAYEKKEQRNYAPSFFYHRTEGVSWYFTQGIWVQQDPFHAPGDANRALSCQFELMN